MMKLSFPFISNPIIFSDGTVNSLIIENSVCFREALYDLHNQLSGSDGSAVLSVDNVPVPFSKNTELITGFVPFELSDKAMLSKIHSALEKNAVNETNYLRTQSLLAEIEKYLFDISYDFSVDVSAEKLSVASLLKALGVSIKEDYTSLIEKVFDYFELIREFDKDKLFITVNMRDYFSDNEMRLFTDSVSKHNHALLMIESHERPILPHENRLIIDDDLCEI